jgi:hypothetical protein
MSAPDSKGNITVSVNVKNVGSRRGKDVVQLYGQAPYIGGVEKSSVVLIGFGKTDDLAPGESQTLTMTVNLRDLTSYDVTANGGKGAYILDKGTTLSPRQAMPMRLSIEFWKREMPKRLNFLLIIHAGLKASRITVMSLQGRKWLAFMFKMNMTLRLILLQQRVLRRYLTFLAMPLWQTLHTSPEKTGA